MNELKNQDADDLVEAFELLGEWEQRYQFIIDLGRKLKPLDASEMIEPNRVHGCQATVHLVPQVSNDQPPIVTFRAFSDAAIVNGLIAILTRVYSGRPAREIVDFPIEEFLTKLDLKDHLSSTRRNGLHEMVKRIRAVAARAESEN